MANNDLTECAGCNEMLEDDDVTYCPTCDAPICHGCLNEDCKCPCCRDLDE